MKREINITRTLRYLRHFPVLITFNQVEDWINEAYPLQPETEAWMNWFLNQNNSNEG